MQIAGNGALVTGGASGLGAATARALAAAGARVVIADLNAEAGQALAAELGEHAQFVATDVTDETAVRQALHPLVDGGGVQIVVNCAGVLGGERILGKTGVFDLARFSRTVQINLIGSFNVLRLAADAMQHNAPNDEDERGVIINTASVAAYEGQIGQAAYSASKAGIVGMTLPAARELARFGIRVVSIAPGVFDTAMVGALNDEARASLGSQAPFPARLGRPDEYAALVQHVISNVMLNGETIRLDGAVRLAAR